MNILDASANRPLEGGATFPLAHRVTRALWTLTWLVLAAWTPPPLYAWRRMLLRLFGAKVAPTVRFYGSTRFWYPPNVDLGAYTQIGPRATIYSMAMITLEDYAIVSQGAHICAGTHDLESPYFQTVAKPILLKTKSWVAAEAFVGPGVTLGEGAVLGARGVTFHDLEPWTVYAGNPAKPIKARCIKSL